MWKSNSFKGSCFTLRKKTPKQQHQVGEGITAGEKLKTRKPPLQQNGKMNRNPTAVAENK